MYVAQIYSIILFSFGAAAIYLGISACRKKYREYLGNLLLGLTCFCSSIWCYGFGLVFLTSSTSVAYIGRLIGMIGVMGYLFLAQIVVGILGDIPKKLYYYFCAFAGLGILLYIPLVSPSVTTYYMGPLGMTYVFKSGIVNDLYSAFSILYAINMCVSIAFVKKNATNRRTKVVGNNLLAMLVIIFAGMIFDTILPMFGFGAIPGSSILQFVGVLVFYYGMVGFNTTRITAQNMSRYVYESVSEPVMVFSSEGYLKLKNKAAESVFGNDCVIKDGILPRIDEIFELDNNHFEYEGNHREDVTYARVSKIPVSIQTSKIKDRYSDIIGYILTIKDMTQINEMMESLVEAKKLAEANSLAKSAFLANMSHEIRTPLNAIVGFSELLLKSDLSDNELEQVDDIRTSSYNLLAIINDILDISKIESGKMELLEDEYSAGNVIKDAYLITDTLAAKKGLEFEMDIDKNIPSKLFGDAVRIRGVLVNILNNAVKYTASGTVRFTGVLESVKDGIAIIKYSVQDTGIGIKEENKKLIFESFHQVDRKINSGIEGTGLGLSIVKGFVDLMGGSIDIESEYGKGSTFIIRIPQKIVDDTPIGEINVSTEDAKPESSISDVKFSGIKVLAVDDNKVNLKIISMCLKKYGMDVTVVDNGNSAIEKCRENKFDIILMDQMMPVMDGIEAMGQIRQLSDFYKQGGECFIIALTANAVTGVREQLIEDGFDDYLSKPINFGIMEEMFSRVIHK